MCLSRFLGRFAVTGSDAGCTVDGTNSDPIVAQDPPPQRTTSNSAASRPASADGAPDVVFSKPEVRPGPTDTRSESVEVTLKRTDNLPGARSITLTVVNKGGADDGSATVDTNTLTIPPNEKTKTFTIHVRGQHQSAAEHDVEVDALAGAKAVATLPVTVVIPKEWTDDALAKTVQAKSGVAAQDQFGQWGIDYSVNVTFTIEDQFGKSLDAAWAGALISEHVVNSPQAFSGFVGGTPGTPIDAAAQAVDPVKILHQGAGFLTQLQAQQIAAGQLGLRDKNNNQQAFRREQNLEYKVIDGATTYQLDKVNDRITRFADNVIGVRDRQQ